MASRLTAGSSWVPEVSSTMGSPALPAMARLDAWRSGDHPGQLILSFGRCHHYCELVYGCMTCDTPMFEVIDREMMEGGRLCESQSMGELVMEDEHAEY